MGTEKESWIAFLREQGPKFLRWLELNDELTKRFKILAAVIWKLQQGAIDSPESAKAVWDAVPGVLGRCNDQKTYQEPGATAAYVWLHMLDRYARTWVALEKLVSAGYLPIAKHGVRTLDVGTGPGPSSFAIFDFYSAMTEYSAITGEKRWCQTPHVKCVEFDSSTNQFRHILAEIVADQSPENHGVISLCHPIWDFNKVKPSENRRQLRRELQNEDEEYFDERTNEWESYPLYSPNEANDMAQPLHRYRLITFSNFLTTVGTVRHFESNIVDTFVDAQPGTVAIILGGKGKEYPEIYEYVKSLAEPAGFQLKIAGETVSAANTTVMDLVYEEGLRMFLLLLNFVPDAQELSPEARRVCSHFTDSRQARPSSQLWAFRKCRTVRNEPNSQ